MIVASNVACHRPGEIELRLIAIDSIIADAPDSALGLLEAIDSSDESPGTKGLTPASRMTQSEHAYHALLTAQALYKAYIPATSDSLINLAWDYYKDHGPYDRRIRAMLYKGTTAEELGQPDSAMRWYKRTELESRPDDHYHRGYAIFRQATLYQSLYNFSTAILKFNSASCEFTKSQDIQSVIYCFEEIGSIYRLLNKDSAIFFINSGIKLAKDNNFIEDYYTLLTTLAGLQLKEKKFNQALNTALTVLHDSSDSVDLFLCSHIACDSYCGLNMVDSAESVINESPSPKNASDSLLHFQSLSIIDQAKNKISQSLVSMNVSDSIAEALILDSQSKSVHDAEIEAYNQFNTKNLENNRIVRWIIIIAFFVVILLIGLIFRHHNRTQKIMIETLKNDLSQYFKKIEDENIAFSSNQIELLKTIEDKLNDSKDIRIIQNIFNTDSDNDVWKHLRNFADIANNGIITYIKSNYSEISEKDMRLIILSCCGFSDKSIMSILDYTNIKSIYNRKRLLPIEKMNSNLNLMQFIQQFKTKKPQNTIATNPNKS